MKRRHLFAGTTALFLFWLGTVTLSSIPLPSHGQDVYPSKNITWIVPFKPGGGHDLSARAISPYLEKHLKKLSPQAKGGAIQIKNEVGGAGEKAISMLFRAQPDGYTIGSLTGAFLAEKYYTKKDYDIGNLTFLLRLDEMDRLIVTGKKGPRTWNDLVATSKTTIIKWGVGAFGRDLHVTSIIANDRLGLNAKFIPFGGTAECLNALMRGDIHMALVSDDSAKMMVQSGEIYAALFFDRSSPYPGAVTIADLGKPELINPTKGHRFLVAPPGLHENLQKILVEAFVSASKEEEFLAWSKKSGFELNLVYGKNLDALLKELNEFYKARSDLIKKHLS